MRVVAYLRVSTDTQTIANQVPDIQAFCTARGWTLAKTYEETASGAARRRPVFDRMLEDARRRHFDAVVVWRLDRFGRSMLANMDSVRLLDAAGVAVVSVRETWLDTTGGPLRSLLIAIFSYVAEVERETLRERTKAGIARARAEGIRIGRPRVAREKVDAALKLVASGAPVARAARESRIGEGTLRRALANSRQ